MTTGNIAHFSQQFLTLNMFRKKFKVTTKTSFDYVILTFTYERFSSSF